MKGAVIKVDIGNVTVKVLLEGCWYNEARPTSPKHSHASYEFHIIARGAATLELDSSTLSVSEGASVLIFPEIFHAFKTQEKPAIYSFSFYLEPNGKKTSSDFVKMINERLVSENGIITFQGNPLLLEFFKKFTANLHSKSIISKESAKAWVTLFFTEFFGSLDNREDMPEGTSEIDDNDMRYFVIEDFFNENFMKNITLKELSERLYLSEKQTERMIRQAFSESFKDHLTRLRLILARDLLAETDLEISEIASQVGYNSYNGFYIAFKNKVNLTPREYREIHQNKKTAKA